MEPPHFDKDLRFKSFLCVLVPECVSCREKGCGGKLNGKIRIIRQFGALNEPIAKVNGLPVLESLLQTSVSVRP